MRNWINIVETTNSATAWHGSPVALKIDHLRPARGGELGPGLYFSYEREVAAGYAAPRDEDGYSSGNGVLELDLSALKIAHITRDEWLKRRATIMDQLRLENGGEWRGEFFDRAHEVLIDQYEDEGFDGLYDDWRQGVVFPDRVDKVRIAQSHPHRLRY